MKEMRKTENRIHRKKKRHNFKNKFTVLFTVMLYGELDSVMRFKSCVMNWTYSSGKYNKTEVDGTAL
jgi:hypothetical protein